MEENNSQETQTEVTEAQTEVTVTDTNTGETTETTYANGKFKSVSALEESYAELQSAFSKKTAEYSEKLGAFVGAPESYEVKEGLETNEFIENWGKEHQLSNDGMNSLVEGFTEFQKQQQEAFQQEQIAALGENAQERINNVTDFLDANLGKEHGLDIATAKGVEAMEKLIELSKQSSPAATEPKPAIDRDTVKQMRFAIDPNSGERRMSIDPAYRKKVEELEAQLYTK